MAGRAKDKKEIDPELIMKQKFRAKCRFRAIGRLVMANAYWMIEAVDDYEGDDVKRRVEQAVRAKAKKKQLLTINDKALLNKPAADRTDHEKKYIYRIIGGLKCFKRYPNNVKKKLAAVTYFQYYGPGRDVVRQHQEAHALYFIVTGKVTVSQMIFDELLQQEISVDIGAMYPGDMFGEVSLLHNIPRTATVTTNEHCEFLQLMREDFKSVLQVSVQKQWDEVRRAMSAFTYFDSLDEVARREGCIVAKLKSYEANETLLGDGQGVPNFVYFILQGNCQMIEAIEVKIETLSGHKYYTLHDPYIPPEESEQDLDKKYFMAYNLQRDSLLSQKDGSGQDTRKSKLDTGDQSTTNKKSSMVVKSSLTAKHRSSVQIAENDEEEMRKRSQEGSRRSTISNAEEGRKPGNNEVAEGKRLSDSSDNPDESGRSLSKTILSPSQQDHRPSTRFSLIPEELQSYIKPSGLETFFMQVCQLNPGASFGFGENMRDRRIVALTPVYCMLMPKVWLLQRNAANIWTRIEHYLDKKIPTKKQLFKEFVKQRRWEDYRTVLVEEVVARSNTVNYTSLHDVPYSIRMEEMLDV